MGHTFSNNYPTTNIQPYNTPIINNISNLHILSQDEYQNYINKSANDNYKLTKNEKHQMIEYLDNYNSNPNNFDQNAKGIMKLVRVGPSCWNGGIPSTGPDAKKCWYCNLKHY